MASKLVVRNGMLTLGEGEERYILIPMRAYAAIIDAIVGLVGDAAAGPLYYLGKRIGKGLVEEMETRIGGSRDPEEIVKAYVELLRELGFGSVELVEMRGGELVVRMEDAPSLASRRLVGRGSSRGACHLERGMLAAVLEEVTGEKYLAYEEEQGLNGGAPYCVIVARPMRLGLVRAAPAAQSSQVASA